MSQSKLSIIIACDRCDFTTSGKRAMYSHFHREHVPSAFRCDRCPYACSRGSDYKRHVRMQHDGYRPHWCLVDNCHYTAINPSILKRHKQRVHNKPSGEFSCQHCEYIAYNKNDLRVHVERRHERKKMFDCHYNCGFRSYMIVEMRQHMRRVHADEFSQCHKCPFETVDRDLFVQHVTRKHPGWQPPPLPPKRSSKKKMKTMLPMQPSGIKVAPRVSYTPVEKDLKKPPARQAEPKKSKLIQLALDMETAPDVFYL